jgi:ABC-2 type transporter
MILAITILCGTGLIVGWRTHASVVDVVAGFALLLLFAMAMVIVGTLVGMSVRSPDAVMGVAFIGVFPLSFLSNAFVPIDTMPAGLRVVASWNPISTMVTATRHLFGNPTAPTAHRCGRSITPRRWRPCRASCSSSSSRRSPCVASRPAPPTERSTAQRSEHLGDRVPVTRRRRRAELEP